MHAPGFFDLTAMFHPGWLHSPSPIGFFHGKVCFDRGAERENDMLIKLHSQATTTPKVRAAIQASDEPA